MVYSISGIHSLLLLVTLGVFSPLNRSLAQSIPEKAAVFSSPLLANAVAARLGKTLYLTVASVESSSNEQTQVTIPRMAASLTGAHWLGHLDTDTIVLQVEQEHWIIGWKNRPQNARTIVLSFDVQPKLLSEVKGVQPTGDGSILLLACLATTVGEKIRYEPQTFKNTVGYWVGKNDSAQWSFQTLRAGTFNVAILQGCGTGQGGSMAKLAIVGNVDDSLDFEVLETGHFQNFQWRHLGQLNVDRAGTYQLRIEPISIKKNALMDVRAVHLVPVPK